MSTVSTGRWRIPLLIAAVGVMVIAVLLLPSGHRPSAGVRLRIVCTFLPNYVFTRNVVQDVPGVDVQLLVSPNAGCPHEYAMTPADLKAVAQADVIVANGLGLEPFLDDIRRVNPRARLLLISADCDVLEAHASHRHPPAHTRPSSAATGEADETHEHRDDHEGQVAAAHANQDVSHEPNPHVWVSPVQAVRQVRSLAAHLAEVDAPNAAAYQANAAAFIARIEALHRRMVEASAGFVNRRIVTFHDAFAYLARDLNLEVVATLTLDPNSPPSAREMAEVIDTIRQTGAAAIFYEPAYSDDVARTIGRDAGVPVLPLNPFNSLDAPPTERSYEEVMQQNLDVLSKALGPKP